MIFTHSSEQNGECSGRHHACCTLYTCRIVSLGRSTHANKSDCRRIIHSAVFPVTVLTKLILIDPSPTAMTDAIHRRLLPSVCIWNLYFVRYSNRIPQCPRCFYHHQIRTISNRTSQIPKHKRHIWNYIYNLINPYQCKCFTRDVFFIFLFVLKFPFGLRLNTLLSDFNL